MASALVVLLLRRYTQLSLFHSFILMDRRERELIHQSSSLRPDGARREEHIMFTDDGK